MSLLPRRVAARRPAIVFVLVAGVLVVASGCRPAADRADGEADTPRRVTVAAAANLQFAFAAIEAAFERQHPELDLVVSYGSSGGFYAQLIQKAPYDIFFSADTEYPRWLRQQGLATESDEFCYARGGLVIWAPSDSPLEVKRRGPAMLRDPALRKLAIAQPELAPYGSAAVSFLKQEGVYATLEDRLVLGESVSQAAHFVASGAADAGILALSLAQAPRLRGQGAYWVVPAAAHPVIEQAGLVLASGSRREPAERLRQFVTGEQGQQILGQYGYYPLAE